MMKCDDRHVEDDHEDEERQFGRVPKPPGLVAGTSTQQSSCPVQVPADIRKPRPAASLLRTVGRRLIPTGWGSMSLPVLDTLFTHPARTAGSRIRPRRRFDGFIP